MNAADIMTRTVITIPPTATVPDIAALLLQHRISGVPVVEAGRVTGIVSEGDLIRRLAPDAPTGLLASLFARDHSAETYLQNHGRTAADIMTPDPLTATPETPIADLAAAMEEAGIKRLPILDETGALVGLVTRANLLRALATRPQSPNPDDRSLRRTLLETLEAQPWARNLSPEGITIGDGIIHLWGPAPPPPIREALLAAANATPGVRGVVDHMTDAS